VSLHCLNCIGRASYHFCWLSGPSRLYLFRVAEMCRVWGSNVRTVSVFSKIEYRYDILLHGILIKKCCVAQLPRRRIQCYIKDGVAPPLPGLNLMYCGSWDWSVCRLCNLALKLLGQITEWSDVVGLPGWCQTVDLNVDVYVVDPPYVRPHFSYLSIF